MPLIEFVSWTQCYDSAFTNRYNLCILHIKRDICMHKANNKNIAN